MVLINNLNCLFMVVIFLFGVIDYLDISYWIFVIILNLNWEKIFFENLYYIFVICLGFLN